MTKDHCNVCDKTPAQNKRRLWPNTLPEGHPLRNICMDVVINPNPKYHLDEDTFHMCEECFGVLLLACTGRIRENAEVTVRAVELLKKTHERKEVLLAEALLAEEGGGSNCR